MAFRVQNSIKSPFSGQKSMVLMPFKDNTIIQEIRDNSHVFSMLSIFSSLQSHYTILILRCDWFAALAWFRLKMLVFDRVWCRNKRKSIADSLYFALKNRQKLAVEALFMLKKKRKEHEYDDDEACGRMIVCMQNIVYQYISYIYCYCG